MSEYQSRVTKNIIQDMSVRQKNINEGWESYKEFVAADKNMTAAQRMAAFIRIHSSERD